MKKMTYTMLSILFIFTGCGAVGTEKIEKMMLFYPSAISEPIVNITPIFTPPTTLESSPLPTRTFEAALFKAMPADRNYMISPLSLRMALAMAANGAEGLSRQELLAALDIDDLNAFNQWAANFIAYFNANEEMELNIANSVWLNEDLFDCICLDFSNTYRQIISRYFNGAARTINAQNGVDIINAWVSEQTRDRINDIIREDIFDEESEILALLINAVYFKGGWLMPFNSDLTRDGIFTNRTGYESVIPFMYQTAWFAYYENDYFKMLAKPYEDLSIRMYFVLPKTTEILSFNMFEKAIPNMTRENVALRLPRFQTESFHDNLVEILKNMGVNRAFEERHYDFVGYNNMIYSPNLPIWVWIADVYQKTFIEVDELGTEAAAVTVVEMAAATMIPPPPIPFYCDRPFIYFIRSDTTGDVLFMGEFAFVESVD